MALSKIVSASLDTGAPARGNLPAGSVLQVVNVQTAAFTSSTAIIPLDNTIPQNTEGTQLFTLDITPTSTTSKLKIDVVLHAGVSVGAWCSLAVFQDSNVNAIAATSSYMSQAGGAIAVPLTYFMASGTTSTTTFKLRYGPNTGTMGINGNNTTNFFNGTLFTSMTITEIAA